MVTLSVIKDNIVVSSSKFAKEYNFVNTSENLKALQDIESRSESIRTLAELKALEEQVIALADKKNTELVASKIHPNIYQSPVNNKFYLKLKNGRVTKHPFPQRLVDMIITLTDKGLDPVGVLKAWSRLLRNKKGQEVAFQERFANYISMTYLRQDIYNAAIEEGLSEEMARDKANTYEVKLTKEGLIVTYKSVNEVLTKYTTDEEGNRTEVPRYKKTFNETTGMVESDSIDDTNLEDRVFEPYVQGKSGDAFICDGPNGLGLDKDGNHIQAHVVKVGCRIALDSWDKVDTRDNVGCVKGLYVGGLSYLANWSSSEILTCLVDPMNIGAIVEYSGFWAMRVKEYFVDGALRILGENIYHPSDYAKVTETQWEAELEEILAKNGELIAKLEEASKEALGL